MWCFNLLRVQGPPAAIDEWLRAVRVAVERAGQPPITYPLYFGALDPRPIALDLEDEPNVGLAYEAYHGDFTKILDYPGVAGRGFTTRREVCEFLDARGQKFRQYADRFEDNFRRYGHRTWLTWNREHFGTKWDLAQDTDVQRPAPGLIEYRFQTIDAPPTPWVNTARERFSALSFQLLDALQWLRFEQLRRLP